MQPANPEPFPGARRVGSSVSNLRPGPVPPLPAEVQLRAFLKAEGTPLRAFHEVRPPLGVSPGGCSDHQLPIRKEASPPGGFSACPHRVGRIGGYLSFYIS